MKLTLHDQYTYGVMYAIHLLYSFVFYKVAFSVNIVVAETKLFQAEIEK